MIERCRQAARWLGAYLVTFTQTQLVITLISLPILVAWGLGYSVMSLVGNLLFSPVLTLFLILSWYSQCMVSIFVKLSDGGMGLDS
jgi:hypothetical protein